MLFIDAKINNTYRLGTEKRLADIKNNNNNILP